MSLRRKLTTAPRLETEGVTLQLENTRVKLARAGGVNQKYNSAMVEWQKKNKSALALDAIPLEKNKNDLIEFYADTIVLNWETGVKPGPDDFGAQVDENGYIWKVGIESPDDPNVVLPFTRENVIAYFKDVNDFFIECKNFAENGQNYRQALLNQIVGN